MSTRTKMKNQFINVSSKVSCNVSLMTNEINETIEFHIMIPLMKHYMKSCMLH